MLFKFTTFMNFSCFSSLGKIIQKKKKLQYFPKATCETTQEHYQAQKAPSTDSFLPELVP